MSVVIVGGNERMERRYLDVCKQYNCKGKVFTKTHGELRSKIGSPDMLIVFTNTVSHKMMHCAVDEAKRCNAKIERLHTSSLNALQTALKSHMEQESRV